jgi:hypothetical protein
MTILTVPIDEILSFTNGGSYDALFQSGDQTAIASLTSSLTVTDLSGASVNYGIYAAAGDGAGGVSACINIASFGGPTTWPATGGPCTSLPSGTTDSIVIYPRGGSGGWPRQLHIVGTVTMDYTPLTAFYCQYGTAISFGAPTAILITLDFIVTLAGLLAAPWLLPFLIPAVFLHLDIAVLCQSQRPPVPQLKDLTLWGPQDALNFIKAAIWNTYCECKPATGGGPAPTPPPAVVAPTPPGGTFVVPPADCNNEDLCTILNNLSLQIGSVQQQVAILNALVTLIQRQHVPFGYLEGTLHSGLVGAGTLAVQGILGITVEITTVPPGLSSDMVPIASTYRFGEVSFGTANGYLRREVVTHNPHLILGVPGDVTSIAYAFIPGAVANVQELLREP